MSKDVAAACFAIAFGALASFVVVAMPPAIYYLPLENTIVLGGKPHALVVMDYYGRIATVLGASGLGGILGWFLAGSLRAGLIIRLCVAWALACSLLAISLWESQLSNRALSRLVLPTSPSSHHAP